MVRHPKMGTNQIHALFAGKSRTCHSRHTKTQSTSHCSMQTPSFAPSFPVIYGKKRINLLMILLKRLPSTSSCSRVPPPLATTNGTCSTLPSCPTCEWGAYPNRLIILASRYDFYMTYIWLPMPLFPSMVMCSRGLLSNSGWVIGGMVGYVSLINRSPNPKPN